MRWENYDRLRYLVYSFTNPTTEGPYLVDLGAYEGNGSCSCNGFRINFQGRLERGERPHTNPATRDRLRCKHVVSMRNVLAHPVLDHYIAKVIEAEKNAELDNRQRLDKVNLEHRVLEADEPF